MAQFRTKARAVELLGKGQIADLPTAISELWKNGYDAYGDNLEAFLYMQGYQGSTEPIFAITDDGKGMSHEDILDRWFVLGTDSKSHDIADIKGAETLFKLPRIKTGEKGIGRLAVAYLGPQMLMLSKKMEHPLEAVFFDWRILENYNLFLSDINIPLKTIDSVSNFQKIFEELKGEFLWNLPETKSGDPDPWREQKTLRHSIITDCNNLKVPDFIIEDFVKNLFVKPSETHSTKFIIFKPDQQIIELKNFIKKDDTEDHKDDISVKYTVSTLVGLFNLFKTETPEQKTFFWINEKETEGKFDLLNFKSFFTPNDFEECDHLIEGEFDEYGEFKGNVRIYKKNVPHSFKQVRKKSKANYGPFKFKLGYIQGRLDESLLDDERKRIFDEKLSYYSGLFIYRDGFRVLPYGRPDTDFLEFEERRGRSAGDWFFAKRNMFGYIDITRKDNEKLKDKSSREGFINNAAFREFKADLIAFFTDLAKKYFATDADNDYKKLQQEEIKKLAESERQEKEKEKQDRKDFAKKLSELPKGLDILRNEYDALFSELQEKNKESEIIYEDVQSILAKLDACKVKIANFKLSKPTRFVPTDLQKKNFFSYDKKYRSLNSHFNDTSEMISVVRDKLKVHELFKEFESQSEFFKNILSAQFKELESRLQGQIKKIESELINEKNNFIADFNEKSNAVIPVKTDAKEIKRSMKLLENIFNESRERISARVTPYLEHLEKINFDVNEDDLVGFYKIQFEEIKEEWNKTYELAQLGIAVEIIDHQFNVLYSKLAESVKSLKANLLPGNKAEMEYRNLYTAFEHLQNNYKLLQPLYRTTGRIRKDITGRELKEYLDDFFKDRLTENKIWLSITPKADEWTFFSFESIFKPVLINIINNAIFWLQPVDDRKIRIDVIGEKLCIMNSGEPIEEYLEKDVFKLFYSNRPKGRGIGLYLAKISLNGIGYEIEATNDPKYNLLKGACFIIFKI